MAGVRRLVAVVTADDLATLDIRKIDVFSVVNLWASCVTVTDRISASIGRIEILPSANMNIAAAAVNQVEVNEDQLLFNTLVGPGVGDLKIGVPAVTTSIIYLLSVEPAV